MDCTTTELPFLNSIGLMLTYHCTIACPHCIVEAGPHRSEEVPLDLCFDWIEQIAAYGAGSVKGLALTGGEPFHDLDRLVQVSDYGHELGLVVSAVSNAFWAPSREAALAVLSRLPAVQMLSLSTDAYHQRAIPFEHVENAVWAARQLGIGYNIAVCTDHEEDETYRRIMADLEAAGLADGVRVSIAFPVGRAQKQSQRFHYRTAPTPTISACTMGGAPVLFPDGTVSACIGPILTLPPNHPLCLGNILHEPLAEILDRAEENLILHTVRAWGPHKLVAFLQESGYGDLLPGEYICDCICDVCYKLMRDERIVAALREILTDEAQRHLIAYARFYYLGEPQLALRYGLVERAAEPMAAN
ncbi:MAG: radical SAM protein [Anaerolineae bacterium]|jgi:MoaA/NifB/PqqE/SkfB family radical SAM enzyme